MNKLELQKLNTMLSKKGWHCEEHITAKYGLHWAIINNNQRHKRQIVFSYEEGVEFANNIK